MSVKNGYRLVFMRTFQKNRSNSFFALLSLPSTAMGFALSIQISALSWILTTQYKLDIHDVGLVWAAGPLAGILGQVIIGVISDKVWFWNGRRRPFILIGGVLAALSLLALPNLHVISAGLGVGGILGVAIAVALTLDLSINVSFNPTRSLIADVTDPGDERTKGYTWMQSISGTFGVLAYAIGAVFNNYILIYGGAVIVLLFSVIPTLFITEPKNIKSESPGDNALETGSRGSEDSLINMLVAIRPLWGFLAYDIYAMGRRLAGVESADYYAEIACGVITAILDHPGDSGEKWKQSGWSCRLPQGDCSTFIQLGWYTDNLCFPVCILAAKDAAAVRYRDGKGRFDELPGAQRRGGIAASACSDAPG